MHKELCPQELRKDIGDAHKYPCTCGAEPDHADAWNVAHNRSADSNLARAYIELRHLSKFMWDGPIDDAEQERLSVIVHANDL